MIIKDTKTFSSSLALTSVIPDFINYKNEYALIAGSVGIINRKVLIKIIHKYNSLFIGNNNVINNLQELGFLYDSLLCESLKTTEISVNNFNKYIFSLESKFLSEYLMLYTNTNSNNFYRKSDLLYNLYEFFNANLVKTSKIIIYQDKNYILNFNNLVDTFFGSNVLHRPGYESSIKIGNGVFMVSDKLLCCLAVKKEYAQLPNLLFLNNLISNITQEESIDNLRDNFSQYFSFQIDESIYSSPKKYIDTVKFLIKFMRTLNIKIESVNNLNEYHFLSNDYFKVSTKDYYENKIAANLKVENPVEIEVNAHPF